MPQLPLVSRHVSYEARAHPLRHAHHPTQLQARSLSVCWCIGTTSINTTTCYLYNRMNVQQYPALYFVWLFTPFAIVSLHFVAQERAKSTCFSSSEKEPEKLSFFVPFSLRRAVKFDRLTQPLGSCVLFSVRKQRRSITCRQRQQLQQLLLPLRLHQLYTYRSRA